MRAADKNLSAVGSGGSVSEGGSWPICRVTSQGSFETIFNCLFRGIMNIDRSHVPATHSYPTGNICSPHTNFTAYCAWGIGIPGTGMGSPGRGVPGRVIPAQILGWANRREARRLVRPTERGVQQRFFALDEPWYFKLHVIPDSSIVNGHGFTERCWLRFSMLERSMQDNSNHRGASGSELGRPV